MQDRETALKNALRELTAMVRGECPSLLNEDSGGNGELSCEIDALLASAPPQEPTGASPQAETSEQDVPVLRIVVTRDVATEYYAAEFRSADDKVGGMGDYSATPVGALANLCATLIQIDEDNSVERRKSAPVSPVEPEPHDPMFVRWGVIEPSLTVPVVIAPGSPRRPVEPEPCVWREKYNELLFAVARAYPGESRHETALRYIREKETVEACGPKAPLKVER